MAKTLSQKYAFTPSLDKVVIEGIIHRERFLLITNVEDNVVLYNFGDINLGGEVTFDYVANQTTIILEKDCSQMSSSDELQIFYEKDHVEMEPSETFVDPVSKFRVSNPENLVDTDFEYGPQASKWETLQLVNNIPSFYSSSSDTTIPFISTVSSIVGSDIITVSCSFDHGLTKGIPITVTGLSSLTAEGTYLIQSVPTSTSFTYICRSSQAESKNLQGTYTSIIPGKFYQGSQVALNDAIGIVADYFTKVVTVKSTIPITTTATVPSGFSVGADLLSSSGGTAKITKISGAVITVIDITGTFADADTLSVTGSSAVATIDTSGIGTNANKYFVDGEQQPDLSLSKKSIYLFDLSDSSNATHPFSFSTTDNGTHNSGSEYTTYSYRHGTEGTAGAYLRIYVTNTTPDLYYYCSAHSGMGGSASTAVVDTSKVYLTTATAHGFADNTNFYFVNTVSPKILEVTDPTATAPDGRPFVDVENTFTNSVDVDETKTLPYNYESTYTLRFDSSDVNLAANTITITGHKLQSGYALLYYPAPGDIPVGGLNRMLVYYAQRIDDDTIKLSQDQRNNIIVDLTTGGTFNYGSHSLGLCYNCYRELKSYGSWYGYWYTYYGTFGGTYSGHDFSSNAAPYNSTYGLGGVAWHSVVPFTCYRPGYSGANYYRFNTAYSSYWAQTYGYHLVNIPLGTTAQFQGGYDFITDDQNTGTAHPSSGFSFSNGYMIGGFNGANARTYWTAALSGYSQDSSRLSIYGTNNYYWRIQAYQYGNTNTYYGGIGSDGNTNMYWMLVNNNTTTNDSFFKTVHNMSTNEAYTLTTVGGNVSYWSDNATSSANIASGSTVYIDKIDANRFRIKPGPASSPYRLRAATGTITFSAVVTNPTKNSVYIADNGFSTNELLTYTFLAPATSPAELSNGTTYYVKQVNNNRFQLGTTVSFGTEIDLTTTGIGTQSFENTTASFGVVDGSYTTTVAVNEDTLEVTLPFKLSPGTKSFNATSDVTTGASGYITIANHYYSNGTRVIYDSAGGTALGGLVDDTDYYIIILDDSRFRLAASLADANNGTAITVSSTQTGTHNFISGNLSGLVSGSGTVSVTNGTRVAIGTETTFSRFYKIGDTFRLVDSTSTPGTIVEKTITAIKDDNELLVDSEFTATRTGESYLIPSFIYVRPDGFYLHRPFDGGMEIATSKSPTGLICRQTRKYFRYQSGKGIQTSFAINYIPPIPAVHITYNPVGTATTAVVSGNIGVSTISVASTAGLIIDMPVSGTGIATDARIESIGISTITLSQSNTGTVSGNASFGVVHYSTITTEKPHNCASELSINVTGSTEPLFNGVYPISKIDSEYVLRYIINDVPPNTSGGGFQQFNVTGWTDASVRAGMFDFQNGFFFEFDGQDIYCVRRSSVQQIPGRVAVTRGSGLITGTNTQFASELVVGEKVVIRGMTYKVVKLISNTNLAVQPAYRGIDADDIIITKTVDTRVKQSDWNIDKCDGTGSSGFKLDLTKIQMCYADYSWYGAGKIRFGFKDQNGHVKYIHQFIHNNKLTESYFRSGNLPARYEIENFDKPNYTPTLFHWGTSIIMDGLYQDDEAYLFTASGNVQKFTNSSVQTSTTSGNSSLVSVRLSSYYRNFYIRIPFPSADAAKLAVNTEIYNTTVGNSFFLEGKSISSLSKIEGSDYAVYVLYTQGTQSVFPYWYTNTINAALGDPAVSSSTAFTIGGLVGESNDIPQNIPLITIRLSPSVDSSISGSLGQREIINRMQLQLNSVGIQATHETEISLVLNALLSTDEYQNASDPSLSQLIRHNSSDTLSGGQQILSFRASGGAVEGSRRLTGTTNFDLSEISSLGNSILGGDGVFPNGPDLLTIVANVIDSTGVSDANPYSITGRVTWKESQA